MIRKGCENEDWYGQIDKSKRQTLAVFCVLRGKETVVDWERSLEKKME